MIHNLHQKRVTSALSTKGTSSDPVYRTTQKLFSTLCLKGDLLEFGAGTGHLIKQLLESGYEGSLTCADILPRPDSLPHAIQWIQADLNDPISATDNSFDVIVSTEVIEHLENPRAAFREFSRLLRPAGTLLVTTPNQESIRSLLGLLIGRHFVAFLDASYPAHITALLQKDFERICLETGFRPPRFVYTDAGGIPKFPHVHWQQLSCGILKGRFFSDNLAVITSKADDDAA